MTLEIILSVDYNDDNGFEKSSKKYAYFGRRYPAKMWRDGSAISS